MTPELYRYVVRSEHPTRCWGIFLLDSNGMFSVCSDYGNYVYHWPGQDFGPGGFRKFLSELDQDYLLKKLAPKQVYSGPQTMRLIRQTVCHKRRCRRMSKEWARKEWTLAEVANESYQEAFFAWYERTALEDMWETTCYETKPKAILFYERVYKPFVELLKADLRKPMSNYGREPHP